MLFPDLSQARPGEIREALEWAAVRGDRVGWLLPSVSMIVHAEDGDLDLGDLFDGAGDDGEEDPERWTVDDLDRELPGILQKAMDDASDSTGDGRPRLICVQTPTASGKWASGGRGREQLGSLLGGCCALIFDLTSSATPGDRSLQIWESGEIGDLVHRHEIP